jgi:tetratricopeptide (TPR) repeat protein
MIESIKLDQQRLLHSIVERMKTGISIYEVLPTTDGGEYEDDRINLAESRHHLGLAYQHLGDDDLALTEWKTSVHLYQTLFTEYTSPSYPMDVESSLVVTQNLIMASQQCVDTLLTLAQYDESREFYRINLKMRRYLTYGTNIEEDLSDHNDYDTEQDFDQDGWNNNPDYSQFSSLGMISIDDSLNEHQQLLDEYHKSLLHNPDGSYYDMSFDIDGSQMASISTSDRVYEGSLRSIIGALHLAKMNVRVARDELELAVTLLRKGIQDQESGMREPTHDMNGNEISLPMYLAETLLNLSYAQSGMREWHSSMTSFEEALNIYVKELPRGESPFGRKEDGGRRSSDPTHQRDGWLETLKQKLAIKVDNYVPEKNSTTTGDEL